MKHNKNKHDDILENIKGMNDAQLKEFFEQNPGTEAELFKKTAEELDQDMKSLEDNLSELATNLTGLDDVEFKNIIKKNPDIEAKLDVLVDSLGRLADTMEEFSKPERKGNTK